MLGIGRGKKLNSGNTGNYSTISYLRVVVKSQESVDLIAKLNKRIIYALK